MTLYWLGHINKKKVFLGAQWLRIVFYRKKWTLKFSFFMNIRKEKKKKIFEKYG